MNDFYNRYSGFEIFNTRTVNAGKNVRLTMAVPSSRCHAYRELFSYEIPSEDVHLIEQASHYCHPIGDDRFKQQIEQRYGIKLGQAAREGPIKRKKMVK